MSRSAYDGLKKDPVNNLALSPLQFLKRSAMVYPQKTAIIDGEDHFSYQAFYMRCCCLASALKRRGIGREDTVAILAPNIHEVLEAHFGVPMSGAVLNTLNTRLDATAIAFQLEHGEAKLCIVDHQFNTLARQAIEKMPGKKPIVIYIDDPARGGVEIFGETDYEALLGEGDEEEAWTYPEDEWQPISLNYTSGTTGNPKGVVFHHRGAYLETLGNIITMGLRDDAVYLWTLPMFHCNGWTFTWAVPAVGGTHICLRKIDPALIFDAIVKHKVTHLCGAPVVLNMLIHAPEEAKKTFPQTVEVATGGAAPPSTVIARMEAMGFQVTHVYGLTETFGPATYCARQTEWDQLSQEGQSEKLARQGVRYHTLEDIRVCDPVTMQDVPADGQTIGEVMTRGNTTMKGYLKNPGATAEAFQGGWFHSGDLGVIHPDGYIEIKDRSKDIIISGGENISSLELEEVLYCHPAVQEAAVVAQPDPQWGETPCAFITLTAEAEDITPDQIIAYCRDHIAHFKAPKRVIFCDLPKTATGKIQKYVLRDWAAQK